MAKLDKETLQKEYEEITDVTFDHEGAHLASTHALQGGASNGRNVALLLKGAETDVDLIKALEQIQVTMSMEEYLMHFFDLWYDDAEFLTKLMGMETKRECMESGEGEEYMWKDDETYDEYMMRKLDMKMDKIEILRSCKDINYSDLSEDQMAVALPAMKEFIKGIAEDQESFTNKIKELAEVKKDKNPKTKATSSTSTASAEGKEKDVESISGDDTLNKTSGKNQTIEENNVATKDTKDKVVEKSVEAVALEKAQDQIAEMQKKIDAAEALEKAADKQASALEKAAARIEALEKAETARIEKGCKNFADTLSFADADLKDGIVKTLMGVDDEAAKVVYEALEKAQEALATAVEKEAGVDGEAEVVKSGDVLKDLIAANYGDKKFIQ